MAPASRRSFLAAAGSSVAVGFAGCLGSRTGREPVPAVRSVDAAEYRDTPHGSVGFLPENPSPPFAGLGVGERSASSDDPPHCVWVWNATGRSRALTVDVSVDAGEVFERSWTFDPGSCVGVVLFAPREYTIAVGDSSWRQSTAVERSALDCNASLTNLAVVDSGGLRRSDTTQTAGCE